MKKFIRFILFLNVSEIIEGTQSCDEKLNVDRGRKKNYEDICFEKKSMKKMFRVVCKEKRGNDSRLLKRLKERGREETFNRSATLFSRRNIGFMEE